mgnify:CR=1 FL=1
MGGIRPDEINGGLMGINGGFGGGGVGFHCGGGGGYTGGHGGTEVSGGGGSLSCDKNAAITIDNIDCGKCIITKL